MKKDNKLKSLRNYWLSFVSGILTLAFLDPVCGLLLIAMGLVELIEH
jgi:hypothetical protein